MNFYLPPSLEHIALVKTAVSLWNTVDAKDLSSQNVAPSFDQKNRSLDRTFWNSMPEGQNYEKVEETVLSRMNELVLPEVLKKKLSRFINPIGSQMWRWLHNLNGQATVDIKQTGIFCWTVRGMLDTTRTAKLLLQDEDITFEAGRKIAALHCLEEEYYTLCKKYEKVGEATEESFTVLVRECLKKEFYQNRELRWYFEEGFLPLDTVSSHEFMFHCAAVSANMAATEFLLQKLTPEEREKMLVRTACRVTRKKHASHFIRYPFCSKSRFANVLCFLLSHMREEQRIEVFREISVDILLCCLERPWQYLFLEVLEHVVTFLNESAFLKLVKSICVKVQIPDKDCDLERLLKIFWQTIPSHIKVSWLEKSDVIPIFLRNEVLAILFLKDICVLKGKEFIFQRGGMDVCSHLIIFNQLKLFKSFIQKCVSSRDSMIRFKEEFNVFFSRLPLLENTSLSSRSRERYLSIIDKCIRSFNKRKAEEEDLSAKVLCTVQRDQSTV